MIWQMPLLGNESFVYTCLLMFNFLSCLAFFVCSSNVCFSFSIVFYLLLIKFNVIKKKLVENINPKQILMFLKEKKTKP